jgi:hypothetical protein
MPQIRKEPEMKNMVSHKNILTQDKGQLMSQKTSGSDSTKRALLKGSVAAAVLAAATKPLSLLAKGADKQSRTSNGVDKGKLSVHLNSEAVARRGR